MKRDEALDRLRAFLRGGDTLHGAPLPAERALAERMGCSRQTLRSALAQLDAEGEIWRHVGQGTFRGPRPPGRPMRDTVLIDVTGPSDLMNARILIEPEVAGAAASRPAPGKIDYLRRCVDAGRTARDRSECEQADSAFHRAVAEVAGNPVLLGVLTYLSDARRRAAWQQEWDRTYRRIGLQEFRTIHCDQHEEIVEAIAAGRRDRASQAMRTHLKAIQGAMMANTPAR